MDPQILAVLSLAFFLGLKHATDADHVAAVTTFISGQSGQRSLIRSCWIGIFWGAGHTLSLAVAGLAVVLLRVDVSEWLEARLEMAVAVMLMVLGGRVLYQAWARRFELHRHPHTHISTDKAPHIHWHLHTRSQPDMHSHWTHMGLRPLLVGIVHGAAGSGALMLLALSTIQSSAQALTYILIFGIGSIAGMLLISLLMAVPLRWIGNHTAQGYRHAQVAAGLFSCLFGVYLALELWSSRF